MDSGPRPWKWTNVFGGKTPEGAVVVGMFSVVVGFVLIGASPVSDHDIQMPGLDPRLTLYAVAVGFFLMGVFGIRVGFNRLRYGVGPGRQPKK